MVVSTMCVLLARLARQTAEAAGRAVAVSEPLVLELVRVGWILLTLGVGHARDRADVVGVNEVALHVRDLAT
jgi:hypothetical protein